MAENETATATPAKKKTKKAELQWLNAKGEVTKNIMEAAGFRHGVLSSGNDYDIMFADVHKDVRAPAMAHGIKQWSTDTASGARANGIDEDTAVRSLLDDLRAGNCPGERGESIAGVAALASALAVLKGVALDDEAGQSKWFDLVNGWDEDERKKWRNNPQVKIEIQRQKLARMEAAAGAAEDDGGLGELTA